MESLPVASPLIDSESASDSEVRGTEEEMEETFQNLYEALKYFHDTATFLHERIDTIEAQLEQQTFEASNVILRPKVHRQQQAESLLMKLGLPVDSCTLGKFLKAFNKYLIQYNHVDLNDLQIHSNEYLQTTFEIPSSVLKVPYPYLISRMLTLFD